MVVTSAFVSGAETTINYGHLLQALAKVSAGADQFSQDDAGPHLINAMREQVHQRISQMNQHDRGIMEKLRKTSTQAANSGTDLTQIFNKFAGKGSDKIGQDELLIAMSRVSDNIQLGDVKELHRIVVGAPTGNAIEDVKVPINEVV